MRKQFSAAALAAALALGACGPKAADDATAADNAGAVEEATLNGEGLGGDRSGDNLTAVDGPATNEAADPAALDAPLSGATSVNASTGNSL